MPNQTPEQRIAAAINHVLRAAGDSLSNYAPDVQAEILDAMREVLSDAYLAGSSAAHRAMVEYE